MRRLITVYALSVWLGLLSFGVTAMPKNGQDYLTVNLPDNITLDADVVEFFWYGAPSSQQYIPYRKAHLAGSPGLKWQYMPVVMRPEWRPAAKAFYIAAESEQFERLHLELFEQARDFPELLADEAGVITWFAERGFNENDVRRSYLATHTNQQLEADRSVLEALPIPGVPALLIRGKYLLHAGMHKSVDRYDATVSYLLALPVPTVEAK
ncbi:hypothetical protein DU002_17315 [Corallincola holothuriorum]|uniref:Thiol:disulfide interchange protein n=1 Tax=Corallincola holothuriorum TaxID=2282215 RepID=A0A368N6P1_9GAMM|nr:hypothetical protein [Corallincola holothuriorum]RCU45185.1 hypothetical protein DU002_17315 [Corallincola holothuriorum]